jgi:alpha-beta hydrolase superfamily lysophospholipase
MKAFYFGPSALPRFGLLHPPAGTSPKRAGVLLCYPGVQEYNICHWAFRKLAGLLNKAGFTVLRFDWACTGDSAGEVSDGRVATWLKDVPLAVEELKDVAEVSSVSVVGMRLGAAVASLAVSDGLAVDDLVLWEPVLSGKKYVRELEALDRQETERLLHPLQPGAPELGGYPFPAPLRAELEALERQPRIPKHARRVSLVASAAAPELTEVERSWGASGLQTSLQIVQDQASVTQMAARESAALYTKALDAIAARLGGAT